MDAEDSTHHDRTDATNTASGRSTTPTGREVPRRRVLAAVSAGATAALAGCSGFLGDGGGGDDGEDSDGGSDDGESSTGGGDDDETSDDGTGSTDQTIRSDVDGIEVVETAGEVGEESYEITVTVENTGGEDTGVLDYTYDATLYDDGGEEIETLGTSAANQGGFWDGDTGEVLLSFTMTADPDAVASYDLVVRCGDFADGVYCE